jgi:hypothetical protein
MIQEGGLVDVAPTKLLSTWRNGRCGKEYITKRLDRFLLDERLVTTGLRYRSWVCIYNISDHMLVILHMEQDTRIANYPFKFNFVWIKDLEFVELVKKKWNDLLGSKSLNPMDSLVTKLKLLKTVVSQWKKRKKVEVKA